MPSQDILEKYDKVRTSLENAIAVSDGILINGKEENTELEYIKKTLNQLNDEFKDEIERLEHSSEWDKLCMAFFGETNAGKSTIIEALRIVYDEESRREEINRQMEELNTVLLREKDDYSGLVSTIRHLNDSLYFQEKLKFKERIIKAVLVIIGVVLGLILAFFLI